MAPEVAVAPSNAPANAPQPLLDWVAGVDELTQPDQLYWWDGSEAERDRLQQLAV